MNIRGKNLEQKEKLNIATINCYYKVIILTIHRIEFHKMSRIYCKSSQYLVIQHCLGFDGSW